MDGADKNSHAAAPGESTNDSGGNRDAPDAILQIFLDYRSTSGWGVHWPTEMNFQIPQDKRIRKRTPVEPSKRNAQRRLMLNGMVLPDRIYQRTPVGQKMLTNPDRTCPLEHQRILALIDQDTHTDVIRGCLRQFPDTLLSDWLAEMEELGYLSSTLADITQNLDFTALFKTPRPAPRPLAQEDRKRIEQQMSLAASTLGDKGAFLSLDRIKNREPLRKTPGEISVLVVEDDPDQAALADMRVSMGGYSVRLAASQNALRQELYAGRLPEILLLDIMLPDGDGFEILAAMRRHPKLALLPVVMLTVITGKENVRRGLELGADGYITKPYSKKIVVETIRSVLKHS